MTVSRVMSLTFLTPRLLRWPWSLRALITVVCSTIYADYSLKRLGCRLLHHLRVHYLGPSLLLQLRRLPHFNYIGSIACAPLLCKRIVAWLPSSRPDTQSVWYCLSVWPLLQLRVTMLWIERCRLLESLLSYFERPLPTNCIWASPSALPWLLRRLAVPSQRFYFMPCGSSRICYRSSTCRILLPPILLISTHL